MANFPLGGFESDFDSKKGGGHIVNMAPEGDKKGTFYSVRRLEGLTLFSSLADGPVRSDPLVNSGFVYVVSGQRLYRVNSLGTSTDLGVVGGAGRAKLAANAVPGDSQILVLNGSRAGFIYNDASGLVSISDTDFFSSSSVTVLKERFWLARDGTNEFFGSDVSNGTSYNPLTFSSAEESPDKVVAVISKKSALWVLGEDTTQYYQTYTDLTLPLREVKGATKEWGIIANDSLAETNDSFAFLADDRTVRMVKDNQMTKISDLAFDLKVKGNGTTTFPGFSTVSDAYGFFVNDPVRSTFYLTFPTEKYTWGYDLNTGLSHARASEELGYWRANGAVKYGSDIICGDSESGNLWKLDPNNKTENSAVMRSTLITPSVFYDKNANIPLIELDMEVAETTDPTAEPKMIVSYTKNGGKTYTNWGHIPLGNFGDHEKRVPLRFFGRLVRNKEFRLKLEVTADVGVRLYGAHIYPRIAM